MGTDALQEARPEATPVMPPIWPKRIPFPVNVTTTQKYGRSQIMASIVVKLAPELSLSHGMDHDGARRLLEKHVDTSAVKKVRANSKHQMFVVLKEQSGLTPFLAEIRKVTAVFAAAVPLSEQAHKEKVGQGKGS